MMACTYKGVSRVEVQANCEINGWFSEDICYAYCMIKQIALGPDADICKI